MPEGRLAEDLLEQGNTLLLRQQHMQAAELAEQVLAVVPEHPRALHLVGLAAASGANPEAAVEYLTRAIALEPNRFEWLADLATVFFISQRYDQAQESALRALVLNPDCAGAHDRLARIATMQGRDHVVHRHLVKLDALRPNDSNVRARLALAEYAVGNVAEAIRLLHELISSGMGTAQLHSEYVSALLCDPGQTRQSLRREFEEWAARWCDPRAALSAHTSRGGLKHKLRIGYVSGEFAATPARYFMLPIFRNHDRERFEITCYYTRSRQDAYTYQYRGLVDRWRDCSSMSNEAIAARIRADQIDVLVDLSGHLRGHRLTVFGFKPAPIQMNYPNHPATTGMSTIQYIFTDRWVCPEGTESQYTEQAVFLSSGYLIYEPPAQAPEIGSHRRENVVFGLFQWPAKFNGPVWDSVARVLKACPLSKLHFHYSSVELDLPGSPARERVEFELAARGIAPSRVSFHGWSLPEEHLKDVAEVDIALDTFPFNGLATTCECLWMGVPVITLIGDTHVSRRGYELLDRVGLKEFAGATSDEYVAIAVALSQDREYLCNLRLGLRDRMRASTLLNPLPLVREIEGAYLRMWNRFVEEQQ